VFDSTFSKAETKVKLMPIYMDRHDVSAEVTAENVAELHQQDLKVQHKFGCRGLTYWFDDVRKTAFCLVEAPSKERLKEMHDHAHGQVPHQIIEVEPSIVESFLGRIEDPAKAKDAGLNIINDPAFRVIMALEPAILSLKENTKESLRLSFDKFKKQVQETIQAFEGRIVKNQGQHFLVSFTSVTKAVNCALQLQSAFGTGKENTVGQTVDVRIGLSAGVPVTGQKSFFEDTVKLAESMCYIDSEISLSEEVYELYRSENVQHDTFGDLVYMVSEADQEFLSLLIDYTDKVWSKTGLTVESFERHLGLSKSKLYRKLTVLTGNSPNNFLLHYRLKRIVQKLHKSNESISELAYSGGFNSPSYFAKCFKKVYGLTPSAFKCLIG
jgi:AraC-like DNA-binding protein